MLIKYFKIRRAKTGEKNKIKKFFIKKCLSKNVLSEIIKLNKQPKLKINQMKVL